MGLTIRNGGQPAISGRQVRRATGAALHAINSQSDSLISHGSAILDLHKRVERLEALAHMGFFARLKARFVTAKTKDRPSTD